MDKESIKFWTPLALTAMSSAVAITTVFITLQGDVKAAEQKISELTQNNAKLTEIQNELRRQDAVREEVLRQFKENQTDIKRLLVDLTQQIRARR